MSIALWVAFVAFVFVMLALDLGLARRRDHALRAREALAWTAICVALALAFNVLVYFIYQSHWLGFGLPDEKGQGALDGRDAALQFLTGWMVEYSLSVDNILVIAVIFAHFQISRAQQHRVLVWGVIGALVMRGAMIAAGTTLLDLFKWAMYLFSGILILSAGKLLLSGDGPADPENGLVIRAARRLLPIAPRAAGNHFLTRIDGRLHATPLLLVLLVVETTDVLFAVDSIPAILGITQDPFLVFTSNVFAILGLRSLYFVLAAAIESFRYLKLALVFILVFVAVKMLLDGTRAEISTEVSLAVIGAILCAGAGLSVLLGARERRRARAPIADLAEAAEAAWRHARRTVILVAGVTIIGLSIPVGLLPGPGGIFVALIGLGLLATEFLWAQRLLRRVRDRASSLASSSERLVPARARPWVIGASWLALAGALATGCWFFPEKRGWVIGWSFGPAAALAWWTLSCLRGARGPDPS